MPTSRRRSNASGGTSARRKLIWARSFGPLDFPGGGAVDLLAQFRTALGADVVGCTVIRIRGTIQLHATMPAPPATTRWFSGIGVFSESLADSSAGPEQSPHEDWMYWKVHQPLAGEADDHFGEEFDVKSKRKIDELGCSLFLRFESDGDGLPTDFGAYYATSTLLMLP